jgi:hypothetical protein
MVFFKVKNFILIICSLFYHNISCTFLKQHKNAKKILFLSDIHLEILYDSKSSSSKTFKCKNTNDYLRNDFLQYDYGRFQCNPSEILLRSALLKAKNESTTYDIIIINGDHIAHGLYNLKVGNESLNKELFTKTYERVYEIIREYFPTSITISAIGNNDFYEHYKIPDSASKRNQTEIIKRIVFKDRLYKEQDRFNKYVNYTIEDGLYYSYRFGRTKFIVLNSNYFYKEVDAGQSMKQLIWLKDELRNLRPSEKCFIICHIPAYPHFYNFTPGFFFSEDALRIIRKLMYEYRNKIQAFFNGHTHWNSIRVATYFDNIYQLRRLYKRKNEISKKLSSFMLNSKKQEHFFPAFVFSALTPIYMNNPGFTLLQFDGISSKILEIESHHANLYPTLTDDGFYSIDREVENNLFWDIRYSFRDDLKFTSFDADDIWDFINNRLNDKDLMERYQFVIGGYPVESPEKEKYLNTLHEGYVDPDTNFNNFRCSLRVLFQEEYDICKI